MKTVSGGMLSHINQDTTTIATCYTVTRTDGVLQHFTDHDEDLILSGVTFKASDSYTRTAIKSDVTLSVDNLEIIGMLDNSSISEADMANGVYDYAQVTMFLVNWRDLSLGVIRLRQGWLGEVVVTPTGVFHAEFRGLTQALVTQWGDLFSPICRADLGDALCKYNLAAVTFTATVTGVTDRKTFASTELTFTPFENTNQASVVVSNTMTFANAGLGINIILNGVSHTFDAGTGNDTHLAIDHLVSIINGASIGVLAAGFFGVNGTDGLTIKLNDPTVTGLITKNNDTSDYLSIHSFADGYFNGGVIKWLTGSNAGVAMEIKSYDHSASAVTMFLNMVANIQVGDTFHYSPGCDKRRETCYFKFNNMDNFRGEPDMPGMDAMLTFPEASAGL